jgi:hypothetical protein
LPHGAALLLPPTHLTPLTAVYAAPVCLASMLLPAACRENVHRVAKDGYLFVTWANHHYTDFALTWVQHMKMQNMTNFMVGAMDDKILASLARRSIPTFSMQSGELARVPGQHLQQQPILSLSYASFVGFWLS